MRSPKSRATPRDQAGTAATGDGEFAAIERLRRRLPAPPPGETWIGDDAAVLVPRPGPLVLTTDLSVAGVHADLDLIGLDDLGWRAVAGAISDLAAMGARPGGAVVAVAGPATTDLDLLYEGVAAAAEAHGCPVVGGDLSNATELVVAVTVTGHVDGDRGPVLRSGAAPGDHLFVTGPLGAAAAGLRALQARSIAGSGAGSAASDGPDASLVEAHRRPRARLVEGETARRAGVGAMIDVSDGLVADLGHVAGASGVGYRLELVPVSPGATLEDALGGGEDYELVMATADPEALVGAFRRAGLRPLLRMGMCTGDRAERTLAGEPVTTPGWEHSWG